MKVMLVNGSPHENGCTHTALSVLKEPLESEGVTAKIFWIGNMERLQTDYVDLYYLHRVSSVPIEEIADTMGRLIDDGLIRGWGMQGLRTPGLPDVKERKYALSNCHSHIHYFLAFFAFG